MKTIFIVFIFIVSCLQVFATRQIPDIIIIKGIKYKLPDERLNIYKDKVPEENYLGECCLSSLWRGYIATFEVRDSQLFLVHLYIYDCGGSSSIDNYENQISKVNTIFPNQNEVKVDWFTGIVIVPYGEIVRKFFYPNSRWYENYFLLEIDKGNITKVKELDYNQYDDFKERQYEAFIKTEEYNKLYDEFIKKGESGDSIESEIEKYILWYSKKFLVED